MKYTPLTNLNDTPLGERIHIGFFGLVNTGKSSLVNAFTRQSLSVTSNNAGTTTDPVNKSMELLPLGPVLISDTPGLGDETELGAKRMERTRRVLDSCHIAILTVDVTRILESEPISYKSDTSVIEAPGPNHMETANPSGTANPIGTLLTREEAHLLNTLKEKNIPHIIALNKADLIPPGDRPPLPDNCIYVSALTGENINELREMTAALKPAGKEETDKKIVSDLLSPGDHVVLVVPVDESAPKGRLILPQQLVMRDLLDGGCTFSVARPGELKDMIENKINSREIKMVITDSQAFGEVSKILPGDMALTSFSILMARYRGELEALSRGADALKNLKSGDHVLICEACTHHRQCNDIGSVKLPGWVREYTGAEPVFEFSSGKDFPSELSQYKLILHCGGCMINDKEMHSRMEKAQAAGIPMLNYGMAIACIHGLLPRAIEPVN